MKDYWGMKDYWDMKAEHQKNEELRKEQEIRIRGAVNALAQNENGMEFLRWLMNESGVFCQDFPGDDKAAAWNAGRRALGLQVLALCAAENMAAKLLTKETVHE